MFYGKSVYVLHLTYKTFKVQSTSFIYLRKAHFFLCQTVPYFLPIQSSINVLDNFLNKVLKRAYTFLTKLYIKIIEAR